MKWGQTWSKKWGGGWFGAENELYNLLPAFYQWIDGKEDLFDYLQLFSNELDITKSAIERIPQLQDIRLCQAEYLPYLAYFLAYVWDYRKPIGSQRRRLGQMVHEYSRYGTIPYIERIFYIQTGVRCDVVETHNYTVRANQVGRGLSSGMQVSGPKWSQAAYMIRFENMVRDPESYIDDHPAGTGLFFYQRIGVQGAGIPDHVAIGEGDEIFTDPDTPPMEDVLQSTLRGEFARVRYYRELYLVPDNDGEHLIDGQRYVISETPTIYQARLFRFLGWMGNIGTIKEYGFFEGGSYIAAKGGNYARFGLYNEGNNNGGEVLIPGEMVYQRNIADYRKDNQSVLEFIYLME